MSIEDPVLILPVTDAAALTRIGDAPAVAHCVGTARTVVIGCPTALVGEIEIALSGVDARIVGLDGTPSRADCLRAALAQLDSAVTSVLVHDVRYPLAPADLRDRVVAELLSGAAVVIPALAMVDSVKKVDPAGSVIGTVDRETLRSLQFPRGFRRDVLAEHGDGVGPAATFVAGDADAFALDLPGDAALAEAILARRSG